jgi:hypothetical protein
MRPLPAAAAAALRLALSLLLLLLLLLQQKQIFKGIAGLKVYYGRAVCCLILESTHH